ncbi:HEPN domain-containing protein [Myxococcota bacterium]|nr:HEPN domain-containing protein [Myxococcota bacterium]
MKVLQGNRNAPSLLSQAAEKIIKAILTSEGIHGGREHQLDLLVDKVPEENPLKPQLQDIEDLGYFSTAFRYPTPSSRIKPSLPREELDDLVNKVEAALLCASQGFGVDLASDEPARSGEPLRAGRENGQEGV